MEKESLTWGLHCEVMIVRMICCFHVMKPVIVLHIMLQPNLYPTVGLQTPGEIVEANFGRSPFVFDIEDYVQVC